jgi:hypothetical protein
MKQNTDESALGYMNLKIEIEHHLSMFQEIARTEQHSRIERITLSCV